MKNMNQLMKQAKKMQEDLMKAQEALGEQSFTGTAGGSAVKIVMNGHREVVQVVIDKDVVNPEEVDILQDLVQAAIADALKQVEETTEREMGKYTRGLNMPGLF